MYRAGAEDEHHGLRLGTPARPGRLLAETATLDPGLAQQLAVLLCHALLRRFLTTSDTYGRLLGCSCGTDRRTHIA